MIDNLIKIGSEIGIFAIAAFFIQKLIEKSANKRLEEFKSTLSLLQSKQTSLHNKRLEIIEELYNKLVELNNAMAILTNPLKQTNKDFEEYEKELTENASSNYNSFNSFYQKNKIYFKENTNEIIDEILNGFHTAFWDYNQFNFYKQTGVTNQDDIIKSRKKMRDSYISVKDEIPKVRKKLEDEFRKLLGVE
tara:strand:- start:88 stop:663 length:576 start_codon:yes stop_codon:yes gene_type:complete